MPRKRNPLIPLPQIPDGPGRRLEADARRGFHSRAAACAAAHYRISATPGPGTEDEPVVGWVLTLGAAEALAACRGMVWVRV